MSRAWINGNPTSVDDAVRTAAEMIEAARFPVVTGLMTDLFGLRAAFTLVESIGAAVDHALSEDVYPLISTLRDNGIVMAAPVEVRRRSDLVLIVGRDAFSPAPDLPQFLFSAGPDLGKATRGERREAIWLGPRDGGVPAMPQALRVDPVACEDDDLVDTLGTVRAALAGRPYGEGSVPKDRIEAVAAKLKAAQFGTVIFSPAAMDSLGVEMIAGLVEDLNAETRFSSLPVFSPGQAWGAIQAATASSGFPLRTSFARGYPDHDPQLFRTGRLVASGEADLAIHVSALDGVEAGEPDWSGVVPTIALTGFEPTWESPPKIAIAVASAGRDAATVLWNDRFGSFVPVEASAPVGPAARRDEAPTVADILSKVAGALVELAHGSSGDALSAQREASSC